MNKEIKEDMEASNGVEVVTVAPPNFLDESGNFYMVKCPKCSRENYALAVSSGTCVWCGLTVVNNSKTAK